MTNEPRTGPQDVTRRGLLSLAGLAAGGVALSPWLPSSTSSAPAQDPLPPKPTPAPPLGPPPFRNRDQLFTEPLVKDSATTGSISHFKGAFPSLNVKAVLPMPGIDGTQKPWLAVSVVGPINQLQIINPVAVAPTHVISIPDSHNGGIESLVWHQGSQTLYLCTRGTLLSWSPATPLQVEQIGEVPDATTLYDLQLDSIGNVWGGTYPSGSTFVYSPVTKKISAHSRLSPDSDYARRLAIGPDNTVWVGTGSRNPRLFSFKASMPGRRTEIQLPEPITNGFISSIDVVGNRVVVTASEISGELLLDPATKKWTGKIERTWASHRVSAEVQNAPGIYTITDGGLYLTNSATWQDTKLGAVQTKAPLALQSAGRHVVITSEIPAGLRLEYFSLASDRVENVHTVSLTPGEYKIQSLMGHSDGNIYIGGYMGDGLAAVNPDTGARWHSPHEERLINQIEAMIEFDAESTYIGSYGSADIISLVSSKKDNPQSYKRLDRLSRKYHQSRPFGWAANSSNVFFGTVPDYGRAGGVLGMIQPYSNEISWVLDGGGKGFIEEHSIIGLAADERFVYGTTSVRNGYGIPDTKGPAKVFKLEISTRRKIWETVPVSDAGALYSPKLVAGWLVVADLEGLNIIDPKTGQLVKRHRLTEANNAAGRPGWADADIAQVGDGSQIVHSAAGTTTVVDFRAGSMSVIGSRTSKEKFGSRLAATPSGRVFGFTDKTVLVEFDLLPKKNPSKAGKHTPAMPSTRSS